MSTTKLRAWNAIGRGISAIFLAVCCATAGAAPSFQFNVSGDVNNPATYNSAALQALPSVTQTVTYLSGSTPQTKIYVGPTLWNVLNTAGVQTNPAVKNDILNKYVVAKGNDGYQTVFALGELNPNFGNRPDLIAHSEIINGNIVELSADGVARVTAPGDIKGGRYVSNLVNLDVGSYDSAGTGPGGFSTQFSVSGAVQQARTFDLAALQALPSTTTTVGASTYTGVSLWDLLNMTVGLVSDPNYKNDVLNMYVVATGSDGYSALFSLGELNPGFGNQPDMIAYAVNGELLTTSGFARVVVPNDVRAGRYVSNLVSLQVFSAQRVPEPHTLALLALGLTGLAFTRRSHP